MCPLRLGYVPSSVKSAQNFPGPFTESLALYASLALGDANDLISDMSVFAFREVLSTQKKQLDEWASLF